MPSETLLGPSVEAVAPSAAIEVTAPRMPTAAWLVRSVGSDDAWPTVHRIEIEGSTWRLVPHDRPVERSRRRPFFASAVPATTTRGVRADAAISAALARGTATPDVIALLERWWEAATAAVTAAPAGARPYDVRPRDFVFGEDGESHHLGGRVSHRVDLPTDVPLVRGLIDVLELALRRGPIDGIRPGTQRSTLVLRLASNLGHDLDTASIVLWSTIEAGVRDRGSTLPIDRVDLRRDLLAGLDAEVPTTRPASAGVSDETGRVEALEAGHPEAAA